MTEPIRLWVLHSEKTGNLVESRGKLLVGYSEAGILSQKPRKHERVVELTEVRRCGTCRFRANESDYDENRDVSFSWYFCEKLPDNEDEEFGDLVNDGTGFCHRHEEKTNG